MSEFRVVEEYTQAAPRMTTLEELRLVTEDAIRELSFDLFAILHHVDLEFPATDIVRFGNYPTSWKEKIAARHYFGDDPILTACQSTAVGFKWSDVPKLIELSPRQREILSEGAQEGFGEGFTVPVHVPGEYLGSCSVSTRFGRSLPTGSLPAMHYLSSFAFEAGRKIIRATAPPRPSTVSSGRPILSDRQLDCLVLAAKGKSAGVSASLLGISTHTVHQHLEEAKRRYGVSTTNQLIIRGLFDNQITFADVLH